MEKRKTREQIRNDRAEKVCRELRHQVVKYGNLQDGESIMRHLTKWMAVAKRNKYIRPN